MKINEAASNIEIQLSKRFDTLTKLVDTVKSHCQFSKETFENIAALRSNGSIYKDASDFSKLVNKSQTIENISRAINVAFENYPQLGADESVRSLRNEIIMIEKELAASRRLYNASTTMFNGEIYNFPTDVVISKKGYRAIPLFKVDEYKKVDVAVSFF